MTRTDRLTREQWLDHGLATLAESGFTALKADKLAKSLGVSRGSFYWHFKNLADFHTGVLGRWQEVTVIRPINQLETEVDSAESKLRQLLHIAGSSDSSLEQAIRAWGYNSPTVLQLTQQIDTQRLAYVTQLLDEIGIDPVTAHIRAHLIYASYVGQTMLNIPLSETQQTTLIEQVMQLAVK